MSEFLTIGSLIVLAITYFYSRKVNPKGTITFSDTELIINTNSKTEKLPITEIDNIDIIHNSFVGKDYEAGPYNNFIGNNFITFTYKGASIKYQFSIESGYSSIQFEKLLKRWNEQGIKFEYKQV